MSSLIEHRMREFYEATMRISGPGESGTMATWREAIETIERLRATLQRIADGHTPVKPQEIARAALEGKTYTWEDTQTHEFQERERRYKEAWKTRDEDGWFLFEGQWHCFYNDEEA